jgi:hypothetical protein
LGTIVNDDFPHPTKVSLRPDRFLLSENQPATMLRPAANDVLDAAGGLHLVGSAAEVEALASISVADAGTPDPSDDGFWVELEMDFSGQSRLAYRACDGQHRCFDTHADLVVRPVPEADLHFEVGTSAGFRDVKVRRLRALPSARFETTPLVATSVREPTLQGDPSPDTPWDGNGIGTHVVLGTIPVRQGASPREWRVLADLVSTSRVDVDLYLGVDLNRPGFSGGHFV